MLHPLHRLLHKGQQWKWDQSCEDAFRKVKDLVTSEQVLTHYDPEKPIKLAFDASTYGIVLSRNHIQRKMLHIFEFLQMLLKKFPFQA
jgi:hypothetical protein